MNKLVCLLSLASLLPVGLVPAYAQSGSCPAPLSSDTIAETCGVEGVEGSLVKADQADCNWVYMVPGDGTRSLTVLRTTTEQPAEADFMSQLAGRMGGGDGGTKRDLPDLGDGGQATSRTAPMMGTTHTVSFTSGGAFIKLEVTGTADMRGGSPPAPFCTLNQVETLARQVADQ